MTGVVDRLSPFEKAQVLDPLDVTLARGLVRMVGGTVDGMFEVALGAALASRAPGHGHLCVEIACADQTPPGRPDAGADAGSVPEPLPWPRVADWLAALRGSPLVRGPDDGRATPLVLDDRGRLYLDRYWQYERSLERGIRDRLETVVDIGDPGALRTVLERLITGRPGEEPRGRGVLEQRFGALLALRRRLAILTGGPGTGKTTTVAAILMVLLRQAQREGRGADGPDPLRVRMMAPTGKAAARMTESIRAFVNRCDPATGDTPLPADLAPFLEQLPKEAFTLHRALKADPERPTRFGHDASNRLPVDLVVVDEASMVDAALMSRLLAALPDEARLILVGDQDQLASVEAGAILGDLCGVGATGPRGVGPELASLARTVIGSDLALEEAAGGPAMAEVVARLSHPFRFGEDSRIGQVSRAIRDLGTRSGADLDAGVERVVDLVRAAPAAAGTRDGHRVDWHALGEKDALEAGDASRTIRGVIRQGWSAALLQAKAAFEGVDAVPEDGRKEAHERAVAEALKALDRFRVLCTHRKGPRGVEALNRMVKAWIRDVVEVRGDWFEGCPVMVLQNDYRLDLFNGDVGMVLPAAPGDGTGLRAWFLGADRKPRSFSQARLPPHETVFAMTIHKSQGSQFGQVVVLLPARDSAFVTRELVYTGITRAEAQVHLAGSEEGLRGALKRRVQRASGLRERLWG